MKKIVIANWKMNPQSLRDAEDIFKNVKKQSLKLKKVKTVICPPYVYIERLRKLSEKNNTIFLGAQDCFHKEFGAWTGKISPKMLRNIGADFVILGHSELKNLGETQNDINIKVKLALKNKLSPVICIGEEVRDNEGKYFSVIEEQLLSILKGVGSQFSEKLIIVYEPVWSVGKGAKKIISSEELVQISIFIKKLLVDKYGIEKSKKISILYGGSVNHVNAEDLIQKGCVDGFLIGRDSLVYKNFNSILSIVENKN
ncbi:MAG: triose-phosphate isomerase [Candidatus Pacebacteria bacterium]|nr:triose-phosphate isomerase [Candidatus Paceibacterota bacterium]